MYKGLTMSICDEDVSHSMKSIINWGDLNDTSIQKINTLQLVTLIVFIVFSFLYVYKDSEMPRALGMIGMAAFFILPSTLFTDNNNGFFNLVGIKLNDDCFKIRYTTGRTFLQYRRSYFVNFRIDAISSFCVCSGVSGDIAIGFSFDNAHRPMGRSIKFIAFPRKRVQREKSKKVFRE